MVIDECFVILVMLEVEDSLLCFRKDELLLINILKQNQMFKAKKRRKVKPHYTVRIRCLECE